MKKVGIVLSLGLLLQANNVRTSVCEDAFLGCISYIQDAISPIIDQYRNTLPNLDVLRNYAFSIAQQLIIAAAPSQVVTTSPIIDEIDTKRTCVESAMDYPVTLIAYVDPVVSYSLQEALAAAEERLRIQKLEIERFAEESRLLTIKTLIKQEILVEKNLKDKRKKLEKEKTISKKLQLKGTINLLEKQKRTIQFALSKLVKETELETMKRRIIMQLGLLKLEEFKELEVMQEEAE